MVRAAHVVRSARCTRAGDIAARCPYLCMVFGRNGALRRPSAAQQRRNLGAGFARLVWFVPPADTRAGASQRDGPYPDIAARCPYLCNGFGRDGASTLRSAATEDGLRRPSVSRDSFRPLHAGGGVAARRPLPGHHSAMSLPKWRSLAIGEINEWPVFGTRREFFPHGILQDVISLFPTAFCVSQPVLEEVALPANAHGPGRPFFPFADDELDRLAGWRKGNQGVNMIGHKQENMRPPKSLLLPMPDSFKESRRNFVRGQLAGSTHFAIDGDEVNLPLRINPQRNFVRQRFPSGNGHGENNRPGCNQTQRSKHSGRDGALRRPRRVQRRNGGAGFARLTWFVPPADTRAGTSQRDVPTFAWFW